LQHNNGALETWSETKSAKKPRLSEYMQESASILIGKTVAKDGRAMVSFAGAATVTGMDSMTYDIE
jgi:hypothetical protein